MVRFTERVSVTMPADVKAILRDRARREGISLSAVMRDIVADLVAERDLMMTIAQIEQREATIQ